MRCTSSCSPPPASGRPNLAGRPTTAPTAPRSLSNTLFRRDAGRLSAYIVDTETGKLHAQLTGGQREYELDTAIEKCAGELLDLAEAGVLDEDVDPLDLGEDLRRRYATLWSELTRDEVFGDDERYRIHQRLRRINEIGYDVDHVELRSDEPGVTRMRLHTSVLEPGRYRRLLRELTGLDVQDNQARRLLNDVHSFGAWLQQDEGRALPEEIIAHRWREVSFDPVIERIPTELRGRRDPAELFHEVLEHWQRPSANEGADIELWEAADSYVTEVLAHEPDERRVSPAEGDAEVADYVPDPLADTWEFERDAIEPRSRPLNPRTPRGLGTGSALRSSVCCGARHGSLRRLVS